MDPYLGGGGTRQVTLEELPDPSVAVITASPGPTWKCRMFAWPIVFTKATPALPGVWVILIVSPGARTKPPSLITGGVQLSPAPTL